MHLENTAERTNDQSLAGSDPSRAPSPSASSRPWAAGTATKPEHLAGTASSLPICHPTGFPPAAKFTSTHLAQSLQQNSCGLFAFM